MHGTIPWQLGLTAFVVMIFCFGLAMGGIWGRPFLGATWTLIIFASIAACGLTHDRIKYGRWFSR